MNINLNGINSSRNQVSKEDSAGPISGKGEVENKLQFFEESIYP